MHTRPGCGSDRTRGHGCHWRKGALDQVGGHVSDHFLTVSSVTFDLPGAGGRGAEREARQVRFFAGGVCGACGACSVCGHVPPVTEE